MEWLGIAIGAIIFISVAFAVRKDVAGFLASVFDWLISPKEWWSVSSYMERSGRTFQLFCSRFCFPSPSAR